MPFGFVLLCAAKINSGNDLINNLIRNENDALNLVYRSNSGF